MTNSVDKRPRIAIVDDDADLRETVATLLFENGFEPVPLRGSVEFKALGSQLDIDLALIDLKLAGESGLTLALHIRETYDLPIVMLSGVGDDTDKIVGLEVGADDYVMKPFNPRELVARIRAVLRRYHKDIPTASADISRANTLSFGHNLLDLEKRELRNDEGKEIALTNAEYRILDLFLRKPNQIIARTELLAELGGDTSLYIDRSIDVLILRLRRKIEPVPSKPVHLQTRRGQGYFFVKQATDLRS